MRVLCAIGLQGGAELMGRLQSVLGPQHEIYLLHVIDTGPRRGLEELLNRPGPHPRPEKDVRIDAAEEAAGKTALEEARLEAEKLGFEVHIDLQRGQPEQLVIQLAHDWRCQLIAIRSSEGTQGRPHIGPASVGHVARFVLDHAACDVLLLRSIGDL